MKQIVLKLMAKNGIKTPYQLAKKIGEPPQKVGNWFSTGRDIPTKYVFVLAELFDIPAETFNVPSDSSAGSNNSADRTAS